MINVLLTILGILVFVIVLGVIVAIHEGGHFIASKKVGILCHEFSIGMGPLIFKKKKGETTYSLRALPLGGYVSMAGEETEMDLLKDVKQVRLEFDEQNRIKTIIIPLDNPKYSSLPVYNLGSYDLVGTKEALPDELYLSATLDGTTEEVKFIVNRNAMVNYQKAQEIQIAPYDRTFCNKPLWARFLSVFAGPFMNFVLALIVFFLMGLIFGYAKTSSNKVGGTSGAALEAGMVEGDTIEKVDEYTISSWDELDTVMDEVAKGNIAQDGSIMFTYSHDGESVTKKVYPTIYIISSQLIVKYVDGAVVVADGDWYTGTAIEEAGIPQGAIIKEIEGNEINGIDDILKYFTDTVGSALSVNCTFEIDGKNEIKTLSVYSLDMLKASGYNQTKVIIGLDCAYGFDLGKLFYMPFVNVGEAVTKVIDTLKLLFKKSSGVSITNLSGPVGIANLFITLVKGDNAFENILYWTGLISVNVGLINLFPLPALDGGRLAFLIYEAITKKKATPKVENTIHNIGFILLMALFVVIFISDIIKCFA